MYGVPKTTGLKKEIAEGVMGSWEEKIRKKVEEMQKNTAKELKDYELLEEMLKDEDFLRFSRNDKRLRRLVENRRMLRKKLSFFLQKEKS